MNDFFGDITSIEYNSPDSNEELPMNELDEKIFDDDDFNIPYNTLVKNITGDSSKSSTKSKKIKNYKMLYPYKGGNYKGYTPSVAASKAYTQILARHEDELETDADITIIIREKSHKKDKKMYGYVCSRKKYENTKKVKFDIYPVEFNYRNQVKSLKGDIHISILTFIKSGMICPL
jgi:hypothetical protein